jgi:GT2 family glycosyltransferase
MPRVQSIYLRSAPLAQLAGCKEPASRSSILGSLMDGTIPVAVVIPTYNRGMAVVSVLEKIQTCDPKPVEIWIHIDLGDGVLERELRQRFPKIGILTSRTRLGPGGGRHRCLLACATPYAVSFDDDSYPVDPDFFLRVEQLFSTHSRAAILGASIWHRNEPAKVRTERLIRVPDYIGCGSAIRLTAYRKVRGYLPRPIPYGMEETDLSLQLFAAGWYVYEAENLRVFHDTDLKHHHSPELTSGVIKNIGLYAFLHYPLVGLGWGFLQVANKVAYCVQMGRIRGVCSGVLSIPGDCYRYRQYRRPVAWRTMKQFLHFRRTGKPLC